MQVNNMSIKRNLSLFAAEFLFKSNVSSFILVGTFAINVTSFGENDDSCAAVKLIFASCQTPLFIKNEIFIDLVSN